MYLYLFTTFSADAYWLDVSKVILRSDKNPKQFLVS